MLNIIAKRGCRGVASLRPCRAAFSSLRFNSEVHVSESAEHSSKFANAINFRGEHCLVADEPESMGGGSEGPSPYDLLLSSLGACTNMTVRMYADRRKYPLERVSTYLQHNKIYAKDCESCSEDVIANAKGKLDKITRVIEIRGKDLSPKQVDDLLRVADMCPVHRTLEAANPNVFVTRRMTDEEMKE